MLVGNYTLTEIATDAPGTPSTSASITVTAVANVPPTVSLTGPAANAVSVAPGSFTLTAEAADSDGTIAKVEFHATDSSTNTGILIGTATQAPYTTNWSNVPVGSYALTAKATDNHGATTTSAAVAVISNRAPTITLTGPADGTQITSPNSFILTADAADADGSIAKVEFYNGTTLLGTATSAPYSYTWTNVPVGNYSLTAVASDNHGGQTGSPAISVTAIANVPPTVSLTGPVNGATVTVPGSFTLTATAGSTTSTVTKVDFYVIDNATNTGTLIGTATSVPYTTNWSNVPVGSYTLSAVATDTLGASTTSSQVSVTVNTGIAQAYYIHTDHLNSPRTITDTSGSIVWQWDNTDPFGNNIANENPNGAGQFVFNLRFPGQYFDRETNTHYNFHRDYDPATGRYIESDPIGLMGGINTYTYASDNPTGYIDLQGLDVTITIGNRTYSPTGNSVAGTINVTSDRILNSFSGYTMENAHAGDNGNKPPVPAGTYDASVRTDRTPNRVELQNITGNPGYKNIQIHNGSYPRNFKGCFGAGTSSSTDLLGGTRNAMDQIINFINSDGTGKITVIVGPIQ